MCHLSPDSQGHVFPLETELDRVLVPEHLLLVGELPLVLLQQRDSLVVAAAQVLMALPLGAGHEFLIKYVGMFVYLSGIFVACLII